MRLYKPIEIARELGISTSALRHYESWGVVPAPERASNGYRLYTEVHAAYFRCLRKMASGYGIAITCEVLRHIQNADMDAAFWLVKEQQAQLQQEKSITDQTLSLLQQPSLQLTVNKKSKNQMSIGEVATFTGVQTSAIRHWEKEGLLTPNRDPENGYRVFTPTHVRQILLIRTLRRTVYFLDNMKEIVHAVEHQDLEKAKEVTEQALVSIHERNREQFYGAHQLVELCKTVGLVVT
ncbi:TioE family transcriptional regulator [Paenibacillus sp. GSMTC-2017]|uniref:TioE family transcriptional regulator n=1 Tax=Paenibacillus sp. GSMTC-2017 TaxID=2794350 RepID=UPI0018D86083|nr:TioE family transcriptional regulator [Paenibacillus sp. GSMTC-2017]MBH5317628.1 TioE family transcriptional regulator [Paenibacillus sp. GSMTC-2017]